MRTRENLTINELAEKSGLSPRQIQRIENSNKVEGNLHTMMSISKGLELNILEYRNIFNLDFESIEEYEDHLGIKKCINNKSWDKLKEILDKYNIDEIDKREQCLIRKGVLYGYAAYLAKENKNINYCKSLCFKALNIGENDFNYNRISKYIYDITDLAIVMQIGLFQCKLGNRENANKIMYKLKEMLDKQHFDTNLPTLAMSFHATCIYFEISLYIAKDLYLDGKYVESLAVCEKSLDLDKVNFINLNSQFVYFQMFESYYGLADFVNAKKYLNKTFSFCDIREAEKDLEVFRERIKDRYLEFCDM